MTVTPPAIGVQYEDTARPYNPFASVSAPSDSDDVDQRPVGGLGIALITTMAEDVGYVRQDERNQIRFRLRLSGWVRNTRDGGVEIVAEGDANALRQLVTWCHSGPRGARRTLAP